MAVNQHLYLSDDDSSSPARPPHATIDTLPLYRPNMNDSDGSDLEALPSPPSKTRTTQPTQILPHPRPSSPDMPSSPPKRPVVQVAASSPSAPHATTRKPGGILASLMAPAGTTFRRPLAPPQPKKMTPITIDSDDDGPVYGGSSSDESGSRPPKNDIKASTFRSAGHADKILESPTGQADALGRFRSITANSMYVASPNSSVTSTSSKRSADLNASAYGNVSKKPRQTMPSRAIPVSSPKEPPVFSVDDILDYNMRQKTKRLSSMIQGLSERECYGILKAKGGNYDDAAAAALLLSEKRHPATQKQSAYLNISDDELMPTPAAITKRSKVDPIVPTRQQAKAPQKSIAEKWNASQHFRSDRIINVFDTPQPQVKKRTLMRGRKRTPSPSSPSQEHKPALPAIQVIDSDESDAQPSALNSEAELDLTFSSRVLTFFNTCTVGDLVDIASLSTTLAEHLVAQRPFKSLNNVRQVQDPNLKPTKGKRKTAPIGEKIVDKVEDMLNGYEAVDFLVKKCQTLAKPLAQAMKTWGIDLFGSNTSPGELDLVSLHETRRSHDSGIGTPMSEEDSDLIQRKPSNYIEQPAIMSSEIKMKDYQVVGINWLNLLYRNGLSCILADDMGLGKTCQVIAFLAYLFERGRKGPHLVVVPAATLENWLKEFKRFCPTLTVAAYYSTVPGERGVMRDDLDSAREKTNVIVTTYTLAKGKEDAPWLRNYGFDCTIYDEGHVLKNAQSQVSQKLVRIKSNFRLLLTGTPLQNNLKELTSLLGFLMPSVFKEKEEDLQMIFSHTIKAMGTNHEALLSAQRISRARSMLTPFILRRKKAQVLKDLPKKERRVELCEMSPEQTEIYQSWLDKAQDIQDRRSRGENMTQESTNLLMKLRQAAIHPILFRRQYPDQILPKIAKQCLKVDIWRESNPQLIVTELQAYSDMEIHTLCNQHQQLEHFAFNNGEWLASGKVQKMLELLRKYMSEGHRTLIFSQFVMVLDILELVFEREAIDYFRLDGTTKVSERQDLIDEFSADDNHTPVFMLSTKAGGAGINLAKANKVIVFDSGFNPQDDIQAENRAHRIGQLKEVEVVRLVSRGTVEEQIHSMGLAKLKLDEQVAGDGTEEPTNTSDDKGETKEEEEGRMAVEQLFFDKLKTVPLDEIKAEITSPEKAVKRSGSVETGTVKVKSEDGNPAMPHRRNPSVELPSRTKKTRGKTSKRG
ncbi:hypothetical protein B0A52_01490 [Exophiala mesophila]|uniref:DNA helicase n=1 Tax=Exophiala mesophila TaxID=212818 RepID=A0A438NF84_EXOME|nr:hypothetical protein B0A52_01490 [Exophiala mesophila]